MKNAGKACNNRLYRHIRTFEKIVKNYFVISEKKQKAALALWQKNFKKVQQSALLPRIHKGRLTEFGRTRSRKMEKRNGKC